MDLQKKERSTNIKITQRPHKFPVVCIIAVKFPRSTRQAGVRTSGR